FIKLTITPAVSADILVIFTAASQDQISKALPLISKTVKNVIVLGLNGTDGSLIYPTTGVTLRNFDEPDKVSCMIDELYDTLDGKITPNPVGKCYPHESTTVPTTTSTEPTTVSITTPFTTPTPLLRILFINDFTSNYLNNYLAKAKQTVKSRISNLIKCPGGVRPEAGSEFDFTNDVIQGVDSSINMEIFYYAYNGDDRPISPSPLTRDTFPSGTEYKNVVCLEDDPQPSDLNSLVGIIEQFDFDIIVLLSAASQSEFNSAFPIPQTDVTVITVGLRGASAFNAYPDTSTVIENFNDPSIIQCMIETANRNRNTNENLSPVDACGAQSRPMMSILFINDFTTDFVGEDEDSARKTVYGRCPGGMYLEAGQEFNFTVDVVNGISQDIDLMLMFDEYNGENWSMYSEIFSREDFAYEAMGVLKDACLDEHYPSDLTSFAPSIDVFADVLVLFTTESLSLPLPFSDHYFRQVIVVGLNGADSSRAYPDSSISINDFSHPEVISCMIDTFWDGKKPEDCIPPPRPSITIQFINDFTSDFVGDDSTRKASQISTSKDAYGKCPGGMYPLAGQEYNYTVDIVNGIRADVDAGIMFFEYIGGISAAIDNIAFTRDTFANGASAMLKDACLEEHQPSDLLEFSQFSLRFVSADILVLFTTESLDAPLPYLSSNFRSIIVVGLNGADNSRAYPDS
ncbi:hypothetical protein PFISCL1PPCAC_26081, partial [Pristionchus fissidentatus]